jgi:phosphate transport system ATP-binding protein
LRALNRIHELSEGVRVTGKVLLDGENILAPEVDAVSVRKRIGMVFQRPNPLKKSIFENVAFGLRVAGETDANEIAKAVQKALKHAALWDEVKDRLHLSALDLSGGQQQRMCIARAIAIRPEVILMDEPCSSLDPIATERIESLTKKLAESFTVVLVTHSMHEAQRLADFVAFFYMGELIEVGPTQALFESPKHDRTKDYLKGRFG